jgi:hypothetical protein
LELIVKEVVRNPSVSAFKIHSSFKALKDHPEKREESFWRAHLEHVCNSWPIATGRHGSLFGTIATFPTNSMTRYLLTELGSCGIGKGFDVKKGVKNRFYRSRN